MSISTVSKALKNSGEISLETRKKIQAFAKLYNYRPNNIALSLKNKRTRTIGVIIPDIVHHFFTTVFRGIEDYANAKGYNVIVCVSDESYEREVINMETLANGSIDGFIMALSAETQLKNKFTHLEEIGEQGIPIVLFDRVTDKVACDKVIINDREAAFMAVSRMIQAGCRNIALVTTERYLNVSEEREEGYYRALRKHGMPIKQELVLRLPYRFEEEEVLSEPFIKSKDRDIDAVLCVNEIFALRCMKHALRNGMRVPEDIAFIGFTDGVLSKLCNPSLTVVAQHGEHMGAVAAAMLIERLEDASGELSDRFRTEVLQATLIERESTITLN